MFCPRLTLPATTFRSMNPTDVLHIMALRIFLAVPAKIEHFSYKTILFAC